LLRERIAPGFLCDAGRWETFGPFDRSPQDRGRKLTALVIDARDFVIAGVTIGTLRGAIVC
jgi:hypothetical protein